MKTKYKYITFVALYTIGLLAYIFYPSQTSAGSKKYRIQPNLSVEAYKSDAVKISESHERTMSVFINTMENRLALTDRGIEKISAKLDTIDKKIDSLSVRLTAIEKALNIPQEIPKPK